MLSRNARARNTHVEENLNHPFPAQVVVVNRDTRKRTRENHADIDYIKGGAEDLEERYDKFEKDFEDYRDYDAAAKDDAADAEDAAKDDAADAKKGRRRLRGA